MAHRTALIAAGSIAIVIVAAAVAVGANLGILDAADSRPVGQLSAAAPAQGTTVAQTSPAKTAAPVPQKYVIKKAGTVSVTANSSGLRVGDVTVRHGWTWTLAQTSDSRLKVTFKSGKRTYIFVAASGKGHTILARVDHPVTKVLPSAPRTWVRVAATPASSPAANASYSGEGDGHSAGGGEADD